MGVRQLSYTKALIICHGKSELQICQYIGQNLRLSIEYHADKNGEKSIQITGLKKILSSNLKFQSFDSFCNEYTKLNIIGKGKKRKIKDFKIFIIMDTDDCTVDEKKDFINKCMFKNHWAYEYIVPIFNITNLEDVINDCKINYERYGKDIKKQYIKIFPTDKKYIKSETIQIEEFNEKLKKSKRTNLYELIDYCLNSKK